MGDTPTVATVAGATSIQRRAVRATVLPVQPGHRERPARMDAVYPPFGGEPEPDISMVDALIEELEFQEALLTALAPGGERRRCACAGSGSGGPLRKDVPNARSRARSMLHALLSADEAA